MISASAVDAYESRTNDGSGGVAGGGAATRRGRAGSGITLPAAFAAPELRTRAMRRACAVLVRGWVVAEPELRGAVMPPPHGWIASGFARAFIVALHGAGTLTGVREN